MTETGSGPVRPNTRFVRLKDLPQLELYHALDRIQANPRHVHTMFSVTVAERGVGIHRTRQGAFRMTAGDLALINCGDAHSGDVPAGRSFSSRTIRIDSRLLEECLSQIAGAPESGIYPHAPVIHDATLAQATLRLITVLEQPGTRLEKEYGLFGVLEALRSRHGGRPFVAPRGSHRPGITRACEFLQDCLCDHVSLAQLAALVGMSPFHFAKVFTREVGVPPHAFHLQVRLKKATDLLAAGRSHVETALETGFCDQSHFCRVFKRKFGITPAQYER